MGHAPENATSQKHYLSRNIGVDVLALSRRAAPADAIISQLISHGHSASNPRPTELTQEQKEALREDPEFRFLMTRLGHFPERSKKHMEYANKRKLLLDRLKKGKLVTVRKQWDIDQGVEDVER